jgi:hypothetical protein
MSAAHHHCQLLQRIALCLEMDGESKPQAERNG